MDEFRFIRDAEYRFAVSVLDGGIEQVDSDLIYVNTNKGSARINNNGFDKFVRTKK